MRVLPCLLLLILPGACASAPEAQPDKPVDTARPAAADPAPLSPALGGLVVAMASPGIRLYLDDQEMRDFAPTVDGALRVELLQGSYAVRARRADLWSRAQRVWICPGLDTRLEVALDAGGSRMQVTQPTECANDPVPPASLGAAVRPRYDARDPCVEFCGSMTFLCIRDCGGGAPDAEPSGCMVRCAQEMGRCVDACR
ncbi:MAG: hypothetical protein ABIJ09_18670 [Pseudomonadota bacterium]